MESCIYVREEAAGPVVCVAGSLHAGGLTELDRVCAAQGSPMVLDLRDVISLSDAAVAYLRRLVTRGAVLRGASLYTSIRLGLVEAAAQPDADDGKVDDGA